MWGLLPQTEAPDFVAEGFLDGEHEQQDISLKNFPGKYIIMLFLPVDDTRSVSVSELQAFMQELENIRMNDCELIGIVPQTMERVTNLLKTPFEQDGFAGAKFTILADAEKQICHSYHVWSGSTIHRGLVLIDKSGRIRFSAVYPQRVGRSLKAIIRLLEQYRELEEICNVDAPSGDQPKQD